MEDNAVTALQLAGDEVAGLGLWSLVAQADPVVKGVLLLLVLASIWSWTVIFDKAFRLGRLRRKAQTFERAFWSGAPLDDLYRRLGREPDHPMSLLFTAAMEEWREAPRAGAGGGRALLERIQKVMSLSLEREIDGLARHLSSLATIGATAPFVGLFGTVWGIMNSFQSIALKRCSRPRSAWSRPSRRSLPTTSCPGTSIATPIASPTSPTSSVSCSRASWMLLVARRSMAAGRPERWR
jgi:biopolymer transport protein TolQ